MVNDREKDPYGLGLACTKNKAILKLMTNKMKLIYITEFTELFSDMKMFFFRTFDMSSGIYCTKSLWVVRVGKSTSCRTWLLSYRS